MKNKGIIFLIGHGGSGTTLLNKVLSSNKKVYFINQEFNDLPFFYSNQKIYDKYKENKYKQISKDFLGHPWLNQKVESIDAKNFRELIDKIFDYFRKKENKNIIGVKISNNIKENVKMIKEIFSDSYIIHIIRDPRDVYLSHKKYFHKISPFYVAKSWNNAISTIQELRIFNNYHEIIYEKLITNPISELKKICNFLDIKFEKNMLKFYENIKEVQPPYYQLLKKGFVRNNYNKWKRELNDKELELIYMAASENMINLGYIKNKNFKKISFSTRVKEFFSDKIKNYYEKIKNKENLFSDKFNYKTKIILSRELGL